MTIAVTNQFTNPVSLNNFAITECVRVNVPKGSWLLHGKIEVTNWDGDPQNVSAELRVDNLNLNLDQANFRMTGGGLSQTVYLQGVVFLNQDETVKIQARTFNGLSSLPSLIALSVDSFGPRAE